MKLKDERLAHLAALGNVAQFVSFGPGSQPVPRYSRIRGFAEDATRSGTFEQAIKQLMASDRHVSQQVSVNIRTFLPGKEKGNPFEYGLTEQARVVELVNHFAKRGYYTIVNETIDTEDGGVSGVLLGGVLEFTPLDTPRGVEKPGSVSLPESLGRKLLRQIYGFTPDFGQVDQSGNRIEFSIHPFGVGNRREHTILWEISDGVEEELTATAVWPNRLSKHIGDKAYGLLMAFLVGLEVPRTTVIGRNVAPFQLGTPTGSNEYWMRTCPATPQPGRFPTTYGWTDPFALLAKSDDDTSQIVSVLGQESVTAAYSGTGYPDGSGGYRAEGVSGWGDDYMLGRKAPEEVPSKVAESVNDIGRRAEKALGPVRFEFVHDGDRVWIVQLHRFTSKASDTQTREAPVGGWYDFEPTYGLDRLRHLIDRAVADNAGVRITAPVGVTSHVGELLRQARVPWIIASVTT